MRSPLWIAGGTTEGRKLAQYASRYHIRAYVSVATAYGASLVPASPFVTVVTGRMDEGEMEAFIREHAIAQVIDATHPYATAEDQAGYIAVHSISEAVEVLSHTTGIIFLTTGSKNLDSFTQIPDYAQRLYARILPIRPSLDRALDLGYLPAHIICMQGPFTTELNAAMFRQTGASYVVTKNSGHTGGFQEKVEAARQTGATVIVIERSCQ